MRLTTTRPAVFLACAILTAGCFQPVRMARDDSPVMLARQVLKAPNPAMPGPLTVRALYYGSGTDIRRRAFRDSVTIKTAVVDGSKLATAPTPALGRERRKYWGFAFDKLPRNGRVWYPEGAGPFPLVLVVHGNHNMKDFSDPGYEYLGRHLASRGFIVVSVDENFLNGNIRGENDARGWMLLQHLALWRRWNDSAGGPFQGKVAMDRIALIGHSRGGEAVAVAGAFNRLKHYPDDANVKFDFQFGIRSLIAIAPIDGQYEPTNRPTPLENVNYLVIHGSHDGDVSAFSGLRQYQRIKFTDGKPWFKSAVWMYRANHGQWNTVWGAFDNGNQSPRSLDLDQLIDPQAQRRMALVYFTSFLEATLLDRREYLPLFRDHRVAGDWLPKTLYATRFQESTFRPLTTFTEDVDLTTGSVPGVAIEGDSLSTWREGVIPLRWRNANVGHQGVWLGWNNRIAGDDTAKRGRPASYSITVPDSVRTAWNVGAQSTLALSLGVTDQTPGPRSAAKDSAKADSTKADSAGKRPPAPKKPAVKPPPKDSLPVELTIEAIDASGQRARVLLSRYGPVRRPVELTVYRRKGRDKRNFAALYELMLQTYTIPLADLVAAEPRFDPSRLSRLRLVFDHTLAATVVLTDVGLSTPDPAFLAARF
jgi:dienelactone hydrolase